MSETYTKIFSSISKQWNTECDSDNMIGGRFVAPNASGGFHGLMSQWWNHYVKANAKCLLIAETNTVKAVFNVAQPTWEINTLDFFTDINGGQPDYLVDICKAFPEELLGKFNLVVCQATFEHIYDPVQAFKNLIGCLCPGGFLTLHTHTPSFGYHAFPRDYLRFSEDWFEDIPSILGGVTLLELCAKKGHILTLFQKHSKGEVR